MKVTFNTSDLISALEKVQRAAQTKVTSNTNNGFFIACDGEKAEFQANDYSIGISTFCEASIEEKGVKLRKRPFFPRPSRPFPTLKNTDSEYCPHPFTAFIEDDH